VTITYAVGQRLTATLMQQFADYTMNYPIVRLVQQAAGLTTMNNNTPTSVGFGTGSEVIDTHDYHSEVTNNSRVTPLIAGYYELSGAVCFANRTDFTTIEAGFRFNGTTIAAQTRTVGNSSTGNRIVATSPHIVLCNGSSDYVELMGQQANTAAVNISTAVSGSQACIFQVKFLRPS
jgi:hypothetical protein